MNNAPKDPPSRRGITRREMKQIVAIEEASFELPWSFDDFDQYVRRDDRCGCMRTRWGRVVGYAVYELHKTWLRIDNLAVDPTCRREGEGERMLEAIIGNLCDQDRDLVVVEVPESNLGAQLFFRDIGFRATAVVRDPGGDLPKDAYRFEFTKPMITYPH